MYTYVILNKLRTGWKVLTFEVMAHLEAFFRGDATRFWPSKLIPCQAALLKLPTVSALQEKNEQLRQLRDPDLKKVMHEEVFMSCKGFLGLFLGDFEGCTSKLPAAISVPQHGVWRSNTSVRCGCAYERAERVELDIASMTPMVRRCRSRTPAALSPVPGWRRKNIQLHWNPKKTRQLQNGMEWYW